MIEDNGLETRLSGEQLSELKPLVVAVVGPTNEGKTSLLRTLTNDPDFGCVNAFTGTTVRAEIQKVFYRGIAEILQLIDTPGFQTSSEIMERVWESPEVEARRGEYGLAEILGAIPLDDEDFRHDLRAWREIERSDVVIFVANVAENPNKSLLKNTLTLLQHIGKPTLVAYNNLGDAERPTSTGSPVRENFQREWDETLSRNSFFLVQRYDAHRRSFQDEVALFEKLVALTRDELTQRVLRLEIQERRARELRRLGNSRTIVAEMLLDVAAFQQEETGVELADWKERQKEIERTLRETVLQREHEAQSALLETWGFKFGALDREALVVDDDSQERDDVFGDDVKKSGAVGAGVGAAIGGIVDVASAGLTFGTGLTIGAFLGGLIGGGGVMAYNSKYDKKRKRLSSRVQKRVVEALTARGVDLVRKLQTRGKAMEDATPATLAAQPPRIELPDLFKTLESFSRIPGYSKLNASGSTLGFDSFDWRRIPGASLLTGEEYKTRDEAIAILAEQLRKAIPDAE